MTSSQEESVPKSSAARWWVASLAALGVVAVVAVVAVVVSRADETPADPLGECEIEDLDEQDPVMSPSGEYLAVAGDPITLWQDEEATRIDDESRANDLMVNSSGLVVGSRGPYDMGDSGTPWVYRDGEVTDLTVPEEAENVTLRALGEDDTIVGVIDTSTAEEDEESNGERTPVVWKPGESEPTLWEDEDGGEFGGVTEDGEIVGNKGREPWKWDSDGDGEALPAVPEREIDDNDKDADMELHGYKDSLYDGEVVDVSGDWILSKDHSGDIYRFDGASDAEPEKLDLTHGWHIDGAGAVYGRSEDVDSPVRHDGDETASLPTPPDVNFHDVKVQEAAADGSVVLGIFISEGKADPARWRCD